MLPKASITPPPPPPPLPPPPPPPPIANGGRMKSIMSGGSGNSSAVAGSTSTSKGGVLFLSTSKKQVPQQQDALLSALGYNPPKEQDDAIKPSVWGGTTQTTKEHVAYDSSSKSPLLNDDNKHHRPSIQSVMNTVTKDVPLPQTTETGTTMAPTNDTTSTITPTNTSSSTTSNTNTSTNTTSSSNTHTSTTTTTSTTSPNIVNDQVEYMRQLAKSRAERKRLEEESRILEQKERAAARLMALERKLGSTTTSSHGVSASTSTSKTTTTAILGKQHDPSMHDSSIQPPTMDDSHTASNDNTRFDSTSNTLQSMEKMNIPNYYEHRKSSTSTGPRMLFDPKSGSMVAAPLSNANSSSLKGSKSSSSKSRIKKNNSIHSSSTLKSTVKSFVERKDPLLNVHDTHDTDQTHHHRKIISSSSSSSGTSKRGNNNVTAAVVDKHRGKTSTHGNKERNIPRTCGVLYTRDEHGSYISVDGCDGDQGYGYHLFPGGRIRNVKAYEEYEKEHLEGTLMDNNDTNTVGSKRLVHINSLENGSGYRPSLAALNRSHFMRKPQSHQSVGVSDETTFSSLLKGDEKLDLLTDLDESPKLQATAAVWAPSQAVLQLTAAKMISQQPSSNQESIHHDDEISETGLHAMNAMAIIDNVMHTEEEEEDQEDDHSKRHFGESPSVGLGLGFDPTKNMDSVMMSPSMDGVDPNDLNISNLELSPENSSNMAVSGSTKSILSSSPWATTNTITTGNSANSSMGSLSNWDFTSHRSKNAESKNEPSASFLSFGGLGGNQNTWGSTSSRLSKGFHGINGSS